MARGRLLGGDCCGLCALAHLSTLVCTNQSQRSQKLIAEVAQDQQKLGRQTVRCVFRSCHSLFARTVKCRPHPTPAACHTVTVLAQPNEPAQQRVAHVSSCDIIEMTLHARFLSWSAGQVLRSKRSLGSAWDLVEGFLEATH